MWKLRNASDTRQQFHIKQYKIESVGNMVIMDSKESQNMQMVSIVITPYYKNIPMLSVDFIYIKEKRNVILEYYDLVEQQDKQYKMYQKQLQLLNEKLSMKDMPMTEKWFDYLRTVHIAKITSNEMDEKMIQYFKDNLKLYIQMELDMKVLNDAQRRGKNGSLQRNTLKN